jgi:RHS repeat-associated protein
MALGQQIAVIDALGRKTQSRYNDRGQLIEVIYPDTTPTDDSDNFRQKYRYDAAGRKIASIDMAGRETRFVYNAIGRLIETIYPDTTPAVWTDNPRSRTEYFIDGSVKAEIDERGNRTEYVYDAKGRKIAIIFPDHTATTLTDNPRTSFQYDAAGQKVAVTDALGRTTRYVYDNLGRLVKTLFADQSTTSSTYDNLGHQIAGTDQNGKNTYYRYDALGQLIGVQNALGDWTEYGYNEVGNLVWQEDVLDLRTNYEYDGVGRRTTVILPLGQKSISSYDGVGNLQTYTDFNGNFTAYSYDPLNRLIQKQYKDGSYDRFTYTPVGQRATVTDGRGTTTYTYNERNWLISRNDPDGQSISYNYDTVGNRTSTTTASGTINYSYNERNWLDLVVQNGITLADYDYDTVGNLVRTQFANGTLEVRQYNSLNQLIDLTNQKSNGEVLSSYAYSLNKVGHRTQVIEHNGRQVNYAYDDLYRLTQEQITDSVNGNRTYDYSYDKASNQLTKVESIGEIATTTDYVYDANDHLSEERINGQTLVTYTYDNNGSTLAKREGGSITSYTWNTEPEARLVGVTVTDANGMAIEQIDYQYDADGMRVSTTVNGQQIRYLIDKNQSYTQVLEEYTIDNTILNSYVYGNDLISQNQDNNTSFYHVDGLGSTRLLTDNQGNLVSTYDYDAFGRLLDSTGSVNNSYLFAGEQYDNNIDSYYLRQRYYDFNTGRFTQGDFFEGDLEIPISLNKFLYTLANPVNDVDPSGLISLWLLEGIFVHNAISRNFIGKAYDSISPLYGHNLLANREISTILRERHPGQEFDRNLKRPDLIDLTQQEIYEIKTVRQAAIGANELITYYLPDLNSFDPGWSIGTDYDPPDQMTVPLAGRINIYAPTLQGSGYPGVVSYEKISNRNTNPSLEFSIEFAIYAYLAAMMTLILSTTRGLAV